METGLKSPRYRFWQDGGGYDRIIRDNKEFDRLIDYVHSNPVRRGLVENPEDWYWSSAADWNSGDDKGPIRIDRERIPIM
jgi:putative transposase